MAPCQATSRIVQATAAVQLFVQRCFLNLEPDVSVDVTADADWLQWQWLDQFRLWQANREIFLSPRTGSTRVAPRQVAVLRRTRARTASGRPHQRRG